MKTFYIIAGGTFVEVAAHFSLSAPAFGTVGRELLSLLPSALEAAGRKDVRVQLIQTRMALGGAERDPSERNLMIGAGIEDVRTNTDLEALVDHLVARPDTGGIIMAAATCDFQPARVSDTKVSETTGFKAQRSESSTGVSGLKVTETKGPETRLSSEAGITLELEPCPKIIRRIRAARKDLFLVGFKTTVGETADAQYLKGLNLLKAASCNLVLANDLKTRRNMVITPEQARYHETTDRAEALRGLAEMTALRSKLKFTRATVVAGDPVPWSSPLVPASLRAVVDHCIKRGAYKPFRASTVGHFAVRVDAKTLLTSRRKTDFNRLQETGLVKVVAEGPDSVVAYGSKPSVGGQSQRIIFKEHPDMDCIVHFHCPKLPESKVPMRSQRAFECGSHECGQNTSTGLAKFGNVMAVMLDKHGPNVVFSRYTSPEEVISFIENNFDLEGRTDEVAKEAAAAFALPAATYA